MAKPAEIQKPVDYIGPNLTHRIIDPISSQELVFPTGEVLSIPEYYNRGEYRFVYLLGQDVIKVFRYIHKIHPREHYLGTFYSRAQKEVVGKLKSEYPGHPRTLLEKAKNEIEDDLKSKKLSLYPTLLERDTYLESLVITRLEEETYLKAKEFKPDLILDTEFGVVNKIRKWSLYNRLINRESYYRPYSRQSFLEGVPLSELVTEKRKIRDNTIDDSEQSLYGYVLDLSKSNKTKILDGIEGFIELFEEFYNEEDAILELMLQNLMVTESGLVCFDLQKFKNGEWMWFDDEYAQRDILHTLKGVLEVNQ